MSFLLLLAALQAQAQAAEGFFPYPVHSRTLDNGLTVHVVPMPSPGVVTFVTWMAVGSRDEVDAGRTGFAHFFEHLMFYGSEALPMDEREKQLLRLGVEENAWTWLDETVYHGVLSNENLAAYVEMEADRFQNLHLTADQVRKEAGAVYGEYRKSQADPSQQVWATLYGTAFHDHTYGHDTLGYEADIAAMPTAFSYSRDFFDRFYRPENATVLVVGDAEPDPVFALVEEHFGDWAPGDRSRPAIPPEPEQLEPRRARIDWPTPTAPRLAFGWRIPAHDPGDPTVAHLELAAQLLLSPVGRLQERLVREEGIAYRVSGGRDEFVDPGLFRVELVLKDEAHLEQAEAIVREEVARLASEVDPEALDRTRQHVRYRFLTSLEDPSTVASVLGWALRRDADPEALDRFWAQLDAARADEVEQAVASHLVEERLTLVTLVPGDEEAP